MCAFTWHQIQDDPLRLHGKAKPFQRPAQCYQENVSWKVRLKKSGCEVPDAICQSGSVFPGPRNIRVGVWLMPDNKRSGELENFIFSMIPKNDPILPRAMCYVDNIPECERKFENHKLTRAYVHSWLATCKKPWPMGTAIKAGYLSYDVEIVDSFVKWLRRLFSQ